MSGVGSGVTALAVFLFTGGCSTDGTSSAAVSADKAFVLVVPPDLDHDTTVSLTTSGDGRVVVGISGVNPSNTFQLVPNVLSIFRWTAAGGINGHLQWLQPPGVNKDPMSANLFSVTLSEDASTLLGTTFRDANQTLGLFRWDAVTGMTDLGDVPGRGLAGLSSDGATAAATADGQAFRWTRAGGRVSLGQLPGDFGNEAMGISTDGKVIIGNSTSVADRVSRVFRWTTTGGMAAIDRGPDGRSCETTGYMSDDGSILFGVCEPTIAGLPETVFRWTAAVGTESISVTQLPNSDVTLVGVSRDGSVLVGHFSQGGPPSPAEPPVVREGFFRWSAQSGVTQLTPPAGLADCHYPDVMTRDGSVVLVNCGSPEVPSGLVKWSADGTATILEPAVGFNATGAGGVTSDGHVVAGSVSRSATGDTGPVAVLWDDRLPGPVFVADFLQEKGIASAADLQGVHLRSASVSPDGHTLTGEALDPLGRTVAWLARLP